MVFMHTSKNICYLVGGDFYAYKKKIYVIWLEVKEDRILSRNINNET